MGGNLISLADERDRRDSPDANCRHCNDDGGVEYLFVAEFTFMDQTRSVDIWAKDWAEAERRCEALKRTAKIIGQVHSRVEVM